MKPHIPLLIAVLISLAACDGPDRASAATEHDGPPPIAVGRGTIDADPGLISIAAPTDGIIRTVDLKEGDEVAAGAVVARLDDRLARLTLDASGADIAEADARATSAAVRFAGAEADAARLQRLASADAGTQQEADQSLQASREARAGLAIARRSAAAARAHRRLDAYAVDARRLTAPVAGRVIRRSVSNGTWVAAGTPLFLLEPDGARIVRAELDEAFADRLHPGMTATVSLEANPSRSFPARIERVAAMYGPSTIPGDPTAPTDTRSLEIVLSLQGGDALRLGQRVLVRIAP
ncbi:efflux RND transporter periplasmic adaptor subunit [uncultured Brevundimonas sp.]|uniref:HlyD family secretion protein n=1 Tax=uncultured Brevundimonas sp. TaxID=213418 RepID=UPI0030ED3B56|tara:strand:- start:41128 stop:42009 length:882 start_codon:yes stop_codon:yes gene_type:complete